MEFIFLIINIVWIVVTLLKKRKMLKSVNKSKLGLENNVVYLWINESEKFSSGLMSEIKGERDNEGCMDDVQMNTVTRSKEDEAIGAKRLQNKVYPVTTKSKTKSRNSIRLRQHLKMTKNGVQT
jgi:hypothetical protein